MNNVAAAVSMQWRSRPADERFETLPELALAVNDRRLRSLEFQAQSHQVRVATNGDDDVFVVSQRSERIVPSHWSFGQLARMAGAPVDYLRSLPPANVVADLNYSLRRRQPEGVKLMVVDPPADGCPTLQAITSPTYGRIWDADVVEMVQRIVGAGGGKWYNPKEWSGKPGGLYASDHDVFMFFIDGGSIVDGGGDRDQMHRGWYVWNSETGAKTFGLAMFLFRWVCGNYMIHGLQDARVIKIRHTSGGPARFVNEAVPALREAMSSSVVPIEDAIRKAKALLLPAKDDEFNQFFIARGFTKAEVRRAVIAADHGEGDHRTLWQMSQGFTQVARDLAFVDARVDLVTRAGRLLS